MMATASAVVRSPAARAARKPAAPRTPKRAISFATLVIAEALVIRRLAEVNTCLYQAIFEEWRGEYVPELLHERAGLLVALSEIAPEMVRTFSGYRDPLPLGLLP